MQMFGHATLCAPQLPPELAKHCPAGGKPDKGVRLLRVSLRGSGADRLHAHQHVPLKRHWRRGWAVYVPSAPSVDGRARKKRARYAMEVRLEIAKVMKRTGVAVASSGRQSDRSPTRVFWDYVARYDAVYLYVCFQGAAASHQRTIGADGARIARSLLRTTVHPGRQASDAVRWTVGPT
jgi:hypothetical protein